MRRIVGVAIGVTTLVVGAVGGSSASLATTTGSAESAGHDTTTKAANPPWIPSPEEDFTIAAGAACDFEVFGEILQAREFSKDVTTFDNGDPQTQLFKGPLIIRFHNTETDEFVDRNASGRAFQEFGPGQSFKSLTIQSGHFVTRLPAGSTPAKGLFYVGGKWSSVVKNADGFNSLFLGPDGTAENLCDTLAP